MPLDYPTLDALRLHHPAWRLLRSDHAALEDELFAARPLQQRNLTIEEYRAGKQVNAS